MKNIQLKPIFKDKKFELWEPLPVEISPYYETDNCIKEFNIVKVFDGSHNFDKHTGKNRHGVDSLFQFPATVIGINQEKYIVQNMTHSIFIIKCDLLLRFSDGTEIFTNSKMVRLWDRRY
jgi:hypothetical protein